MVRPVPIVRRSVASVPIRSLLLVLAVSAPSCACFGSPLGFAAGSRRTERVGGPLWQLPVRRPSLRSIDGTTGGVAEEEEEDEQERPSRRIVSTARSVACTALMENVRQRNRSAFAVRRLENDPDFLRLDARDRAFARLLLTTAERRLGQIDSVIGRFVKSSNRFRKNRDSDMLCQSVLRVGAAQLLFMDVPVYAVGKETVQVLRLVPGIRVQEQRIKFVNAVLRNIQRAGKKLVNDTSVYDNMHPRLIRQWKSTYGDDTTDLIVNAFMEEPSIFLSVNHRGNMDPKQRLRQTHKIIEAFHQLDGDTSDSIVPLPHGSIQMPRSIIAGSIDRWPGYDKGDWWVQDPSATIPAIALYNTLKTDRVEDMHVIDLCSAPGGKTAQLCSFGFGKVTAVEISERRTRTLTANLARLGMDNLVKSVTADGTEWNVASGQPQPHGVLVDAPCSATGVGRRRPDVLRKEPDLEQLLDVQRRLAEHTVDSILGIGGILVYATCSLLKQESEDQVHRLLQRTTGASVETVPFVPGEIEGFDDAIDENGWMRVVPGTLNGPLNQCDGFFVARLRRTA